MNILFVHGRSQQGKIVSELESEWNRALDKGFNHAGVARPSGVRTVMPFYGDDLDRLVRELDTPLAADVASRGGADFDREEMEFMLAVYSAMANGYGIPEANIAEEMDVAPAERGPMNWRWVHAVLRALDDTPLGAKAIDRFTRDVFVYLTNPAVRRHINKIVLDCLTPGQWVVVSHSLGTVVAFNVLRSLATASGITVPLFVTLGSPLGIEPVRDHLATPLDRPGCVKQWYNAYDPRDVVSLYALEAPAWDLRPPIANHKKVKNWTDNRHGIIGYLDDRLVAAEIEKALK